MKVLFVSDNAKLSNPFVETLIAGLYEFNLDCTASIKEWWANVEEYDIIHFQWPEIVFYWEHIRTKDLQEMEMQLQKAKSLGIKIVITCHNLKPHLKKNQDMVALYQLIYEYCDAFVHMGEYSFKLLQSDYPQAKHFIIPHHLYDNIYKFDKGRNESCVKLKMLDNRINILCFGQFRTDEERDLILKLRKHKDMQNVNFIVPGFFRHRLICKRPLEMLSRIWHYIRYRMEGVEFVNRVLSTTETETYFCACDIVFIQRFSVLNSGNLPMGFGAGCVVVGPNVGNVGSILNKTGNPIFNPYDIDSIVLAIKKAKELLSVNKGEENKMYAQTKWNTSAISRQLAEVYRCLKNE